MFLGHFALGLAAKRAEARPLLGTYIAAAQLPDLLWPAFLLLGWERVAIAPGDTAFTPLRFESYPVSHSLVAVAGWATLFAGAHWLRRRSAAAAGWIWALVLSHWALDLVTHRPDMPLLPWGGPKLGLGLWRSVAATLVVEGLMFAGAVWLYVSGTRAKDAAGTYGLAGLVLLLVAAYLGNVLGPPPPSHLAIAIVGLLGGALLVAWASWADAHRAPAP